MNTEKHISLIRLPTPGYPFDRNEQSPGLLDLSASVTALAPGWIASINDLAGTYPGEWKDKINLSADAYGISVMTPQREILDPFLSFLKKINVNAMILVGGKDPTARPQIYEKNQKIDAVFTYEADETLPAYLIGNKQLIRKVIAPTKPPNLERIPAYSLEGIPIYGRRIFDELTTSFTFVRGCPFPCRFCTAGSAPKEYKKTRHYSDERNKSIIEDAVQRGFKAAFIRDDNFRYSNDSFYEKILTQLNDAKMIFRFNLAAAIKPDKHSLREIYKNGGRIADMALESGDPYVLESMQKKHTPEQFINTVHAAQDEGLIVYTYVMSGFPGETDKSTDLTIKTLRAAGADFTLAFPFVPYPGTVIGDNLMKYGYTEDNVNFGVHVCDRADGSIPVEKTGGSKIIQNRIDRILSAVSEMEKKPDKPYENFSPIKWDLERFKKELALVGQT